MAFEATALGGAGRYDFFNTAKAFFGILLKASSDDSDESEPENTDSVAEEPAAPAKAETTSPPDLGISVNDNSEAGESMGP